MMSQTALPSTKPHAVGLSAERLGQLGDVLAREVAGGRLPGAVALVARRGKVAYVGSFGRRDPASDAAMSVDSIFRVYSMTKPIVSVAAMMLVEQGLALLADPLAKYMPAFAGAKVAVERAEPGDRRPRLDLVPAARPVTLQDLLRQTSGYTYEHTATEALKPLYHEAGTARRDQNLGDLAGKLATLPLTFQPGTRWRYGHSTDLLARVIEIITGKRLGEALNEMILQPLGMKDSGFFVPESERHRLAEPFAKDPESGAAVSLIPVNAPPQLESGGGGLVSTAEDYLKFLLTLARGGGYAGGRLLSRKTIEWMTADHLGGAATVDLSLLPIGYGFGLGFAVRREAGVANMAGSRGEYFWGGVAGTTFFIDPQEQLVGVFMMQGPGQRDYFRTLFRNLVYAAIDD